MNEILGITIGSVTIGGIIIFLGKIIINKVFDVAFKDFENKLELLKIEHQIRFSKLHDERADLLKKMYHELYELIKALRQLTASFQGQEWTEDKTSLETATNKLKDCIDLFEPNRIFFPKLFCDKLEENLEQSRLAIYGWRVTVKKGKREEDSIIKRMPNPYNEGDTSIDWWRKIEEKITCELEDNRKKLADDFRKLIGVEII